MIFQFENQTVNFILWLVVGTIILGLFINLSIRFIVSKTKASDKVFMEFLVAFLGIFLIPIIAGAIGSILTAIGSLPAMLPWGGNFMGLLVPVVQYLMFLIAIKFLLDEDWGHATWISLIAMFLLYFLYSCFPILYTYIGTL